MVTAFVRASRKSKGGTDHFFHLATLVGKSHERYLLRYNMFVLEFIGSPQSESRRMLFIYLEVLGISSGRKSDFKRAQNEETPLGGARLGRGMVCLGP